MIKFEMVDKDKSILEEAQELVNGDRGRAYGHPILDFTRTSKMWSVILDADVSPQQVGLCMIALKLSRECNKHNRDNVLDIAGYALTVQMIEEHDGET